MRICAKGVQLEGSGKPAEASSLFMQACNEASNDTEKFIATHYVVRHNKRL